MSFILGPECRLYERRSEKILSTIVSFFTSAYCLHWPSHFPNVALTAPYPSFDGRAVCYPTLKTLRDYLSWRQVDCHVNNLYNTVFWALVERGGMSNRAAEEALKGTYAAEKNEILWGRFGVNYNHVEGVFRKGSVVFRDVRVVEGGKLRVTNGVGATGVVDPAERMEEQVGDEDDDEGKGTEADPRVAQVDRGASVVTANLQKRRSEPGVKWKSTISIMNEDIIKDTFWKAHPWILESGTARKRAIRAYFSSRSEKDNANQAS